MAVPAGYFFKDGYYWKNDQTGPYKIVGGTPTLLGSLAAPPANSFMQCGKYYPRTGGVPTHQLIAGKLYAITLTSGAVGQGKHASGNWFDNNTDGPKAMDVFSAPYSIA